MEVSTETWQAPPPMETHYVGSPRKGARLVTDDRCKDLVEYVVAGTIMGPYACLGLADDDGVYAAALMSEFAGSGAAVTVVGTGFTRRFLIEFYRFALIHFGLSRLSVTTEQPKVAEYAIRFGGKVEGVLRDFYGEGRPGTLIGILKKDWRFKP